MVAMPPMPHPVIPIVGVIPIMFIMDMPLIIFFMSFIMPIIGILPIPPCGAVMPGWLGGGAGFTGAGAGAALPAGWWASWSAGACAQPAVVIAATMNAVVIINRFIRTSPAADDESLFGSFLH